MRLKKTFIIQTRTIIERKRDGTRLHTIRWGRYKTWNKKSTPIGNMQDAINNIKKVMLRQHKGYVVYRRVMLGGKPTHNIEPLFQAKWGHDGKPFAVYKPLGLSWIKGKIC
jgi:hypothetical protein